jgi:hypothetical protein
LAAAQAEAAPYAAAAVTVQNAAAVLNIVPEDRSDVDVVAAAGAHLPAPGVRVVGNRVVIDGGLAGRIQGCGGWFQIEVNNQGAPSPIRVAGVGTVPVDQLQRITVHVPRTLDLEVGAGVHSTIGASQGGRAVFNGCGRADIARTDGPFDLTLNGSGDVNLASAGGPLQGVLNGSGDLRVEHADGMASLRLQGSGDVTAGDIAGALSAELEGSGDIRARSAAGAQLTLRGSGDVAVGEVRGVLSARVDGSGDMVVAAAEAPSMVLDLDGSGEIAVRSGHANVLEASNRGSGEIRFGGSANTSKLEVAASGDVSVADAGRVQDLNDHGSGSVRIGR